MSINIFCDVLNPATKSFASWLWTFVKVLWPWYWLWIVIGFAIWILFEVKTRNGRWHYNSKNGFSPTFNRVVGSGTYIAIQSLFYFLLQKMFGPGVYCFFWPYALHLLVFILTGGLLYWIGFWVYWKLPFLGGNIRNRPRCPTRPSPIKCFIDLFKSRNSAEIQKINNSSHNQLLIEKPLVSTIAPEATSEEKPKESAEKWHMPLPQEYFATPSQPYLQEDWNLYGRFGHHTGTDYGGRKRTGIPLFACADGEIIYRDIADSAWGKHLGNLIALYVPSVGKSFLYCHLAEEPRPLGPIKGGEQIGIMGNTGKSAGNAIHLHLEGFHGRFEISWRSFKSLDDIKEKTFDADQFIRSRIQK